MSFDSYLVVSHVAVTVIGSPDLRRAARPTVRCNFPGWWWSVTTRSHVVYESWLERHHIIEADRDARVTGIAGQPFALTWPSGRRQAQHVPDIFCRTFDGSGVVTDCRSVEKADDEFRYKCSVTAAACQVMGWEFRSRLSAQHTATDFRSFLDQIDKQVEPGLEVHVICDNLSTHKAPAVQKWLLAHPRFVLHFTPAYSSWINQVERWFAEIQRRCLERGVFCSLEELTAALQEWIKLWNDSAKPFKGTKTPDQIIDAICRYCDRISRPAH
jgi:transposase